MIRVSLLVPCLDPGAYLAPCLAGVLSQLEPEDEVIVQDCLSTDGSAELLDRMAATDPRLSVRHERDSGQSDGLNRALARATGDVVGWLNADDLVLPGALDAVRRGWRDDTDLAIGSWQLLAADGAVLRRHEPSPLQRTALLLRGNYVFSGAVFVRRTLLAELGGYRSDLHYVMDYDLVLRLATAANNQVILPAEVAAFRTHGASKSRTHVTGFLKEGLSVRKNSAADPGEAAAAAAGAVLHSGAVALHRLWWTRGWNRIREQVAR